MNRMFIPAFWFLALVLCTFSARAQQFSPAPGPTADVSSPDDDLVAALPSGTVEPTPAPVTQLEQEIMDQVAFQSPSVNVNIMPSLFFSLWEHDLIVDARRGLKTRLPGDDDGVELGVRDITLGGIVFVSAKEWTIWLNSVRVSPDALPEEVMDLKVHKDYIDIEWFDAGTNQIFPIRLRAHQRFNLDTRMFLPG